MNFNKIISVFILRNEKEIKLNEWHIVHFWRIGRDGYLQVDSDEHIMTNYSFGLQVQLTLTYSLYLGGHPNANFISTHIKPFIGYATNLSIGFQGCINKVCHLAVLPVEQYFAVISYF